ncbi:beta-D-xylosidase [Trifolium repens]|nr:beta-D-xylosidase [Trifolium repens]
MSENDLNLALANLITVQMRLGMFDGPAQPYGNLGTNIVCLPAHNEVAVEAARQGIVLLQNKGNALPLSPTRYRTVAVIGPNSDVTETMIGNYAGVACGYTTPLQGIARYVRTLHQAGCGNVACGGNQLFGAAETVARQADATVLVMGLDQSIEAEFRDRVGLLLPGHQQELVSRVARAARGPVILVLMSGGPIDVTFAKNDPKISAILWVGYPGQSGGTAIADIIFGRTNPGGRLPNTWYPQSYVAKVPMTNMDMRPNPAIGYPGRTYRFYKGPVVFPFGHGLSYSRFTHTLALAPKQVSVQFTTSHSQAFTNSTNKAMKVSHAKCDGLELGFHVDVKNEGSMDGSHTLLIFSKPPNGVKQLVNFHKTYVHAGSKTRVKVGVHVCNHLSSVDEFGVRRIPIVDVYICIFLSNFLTQTFLSLSLYFFILSLVFFSSSLASLPCSNHKVREMAECNREDYFLVNDIESTSAGKKYGGLVPKKKPLISKDNERAFFDSADWALCKQGAGLNQQSTAAVETLRPKLKKTPHQQLPPRRPACTSG